MGSEAEIFRASNGVSGVVVNIPGSPIFYSQLTFGAGTQAVANYWRKKELAHIMEHMAFYTDEYKTKGELDEEFNKNGGYGNAYTSQYDMDYVAQCASFEWERILALQIKMLGSPKFTESALNIEKRNVTSELEGHVDDPSWTIWCEADQRMGMRAMPADQALKTIPNVTLADVVEHHDRTHVLSNMSFAVAGDFTADKLCKLDEIISSCNLPSGKTATFESPNLSKASAFIYHRKDTPAVSMYLPLVIHRQVSIREELTMALIRSMLAGNMNSPIYGAIRAQGLAYSLRMLSSIDRFSSSIFFSSQATADNWPRIIEIISSALKNVIDGGVQPDDIERAKARLTGECIMDLETAELQAVYQLSHYRRSGQIINFNDLPKIIATIKADDVVQMLTEFIDADTWTLGLMGTVEQLLADRLHNDLSEQLFA